jgi:fructose-1,6-bisphosphatase
MTITYHIGTAHFLFEDDYRTIIHEKQVDLPNAARIAAFSNGHRIELDDAGAKFIGTVKDVKHWIQIDDSGNYIDSVFVHCGSSYQIGS